MSPQVLALTKQWFKVRARIFKNNRINSLVIKCQLLERVRKLPVPAILVFLVWFSSPLPANEVDYQRDIQPILAERCAHCHGVDEATREGGLRLDSRDGGLRGGDSGEPAIVPGKPDESELIRRVSSADDGDVMPPPDDHERLSAKQVEQLTEWVRQGAVYDVHWSFAAPEKIELPTGPSANPVDALVQEKLTQVGLSPAPAENSNVLCRRLYLDLIGLPPSPEDLKAFQQQGFAATLERLLGSERYGEKWARHWMDLARYSDTNGYEKDLKRDQWIWRDWVIDALNQDLPYDQFLIQQIAGDLLPGATQSQLIATGFLRNSMVNEEGAIIPEQFRMVEMFDRVDCVGKAVLGLTTQCAQCHSHKYDPITMDEYYGMFAFLNNSYEAQSWVYTEDQQSKINSLTETIESAEQRLREQVADWQAKLQAWEENLSAQCIPWQPITFHDLNSVSGLNHPVQQADLSVLMLGHASADVYMIAAPEMRAATGLRLEALTHGDLPFRGPGRNSVGGWAVRELEVFVKPTPSDQWEKIKLVNATADFSQLDQKESDGKKGLGPVAYLIDGSNDTQWKADRGVGRRNAPSVAVVQFESPLDLPAGCELKIAMRMSDMLGCCRFSLTTAAEPKALPVDYEAVLAVEVAPEARSAKQTASLFRQWRRALPEADAINAEIEAAWQLYPEALTSVLHLHQRDASESRRTHRLERGNWDQPVEIVQPHVPAAFHTLPESDEPKRLKFARWLVDERSPLTARVAVNRVWQNLFGVGLVETAEDFGTRATVPEHRELLDWLAVDFMEHGWSQKHLLRTILNSSTYQQSSRVTPDRIQRDPQNRYFSRAPRYRADAEVVRDIALSVSGLIHHKLGGPSVIPPVPKNVLDYNYVYPSYWKPAEGDDRYRRAVYGFRKRSMPDPAMSSFDSPNGDLSCARRERSNTPLAALTGLNETIFVEAARALALRVLREGGSNDESQVQYAYLLCVSRLPTDGEKAAVLELLQSRRKKLADGWLDVRAITTGDPDRLPDLPAAATPQDAAAWTIVSRVLLNLDETISKN